MDAVGVYWGAALIAVGGVSFGRKLVVVLLAGGAAYDADAVYQLGAMETFVEAGVDMWIPSAFYVPTTGGASLRDSHLLADDDGNDDGTSKISDAEFKLLGVGDVLVPGLLVASGTQFLSANRVFWVLNAPVVGALAGALGGLFGVEQLGRRLGGMHAGLPVLNAATLAGYFVGVLVAGLTVREALGL